MYTHMCMWCTCAPANMHPSRERRAGRGAQEPSARRPTDGCYHPPRLRALRHNPSSERVILESADRVIAHGT
jgi:hypothetical protein